MGRTSFSQKLVLESPELVCVYLRGDLEAVQRKEGEVILDINHLGNWVRGFEVVGGFVPFSLAKAVSPFSPVRPVPPKVPEEGTVTYDPEADAAFFYLEYGPKFARLAPSEQAELKRVSHCVNPTALYGLDDSGGLVWIKVPIADAGPTGRLLQLLRM
jgi:hypothetical protein